MCLYVYLYVCVCVYGCVCVCLTTFMGFGGALYVLAAALNLWVGTVEGVTYQIFTSPNSSVKAI